MPAMRARGLTPASVRARLEAPTTAIRSQFPSSLHDPRMHKPSMSSESPFLVAGGDPAAVVDAIARTARKVRTPCGDDSMVWRVWGEGEPLVLFHGGSGSWAHWVRNNSGPVKHHEPWLPRH